jgi:hypothetical protein
MQKGLRLDKGSWRRMSIALLLELLTARRRLSSLQEAFSVAVELYRRLVGGACHGELVVMILSPS